MKKLKKALEDRADKLNKFEALTEAAKGRELTDEETSQLSAFNDEIEVLDKEIKSLQGIEARTAKIAAEKSAAGVGAPQDGASEIKELKQYSYAKAFKDVHNAKAGRIGEVKGFEKEMHEEAHKEAQEAGIQLSGNICIPSRLIQIGKPLTSAPLTVGTEGTDVVQTEYKPMIPFLHIEPMVDRLGITKYTGLVGNLKIPRSSNDLALAWETETSAADETTLTFDSIDLAPKRLAGYTDVTIQMLRQAPFMLENYIREKLKYAYEAAIDTAVLAGPTGGNSPVGILNYSGVNVVSLGTSGGDITYGALIAMITAPMADNARQGKSGFVFNTNGLASLALTPFQTGGVEGNFILKPSDTTLWGRPFIVTNRIPSNLAETATGLSGMIYSSNWSSAILATWGGLDILFDPYTQALTGTVRFVVNTFADVDIERPEEFAVIKDWNTTLPELT
jgi:HK97 family phage major capsid protein